MNNTQRKILTYLADPIRTYPDEMLTDFVTRGILSKNSMDDETLEAFEKYLDENTRGFCPAGIERARIALGIKPKFREGDKVTQKDFKDLPVGSGVLYDGKNHMVIRDGGIVSQVDGKSPSYASTATFTIGYLADQ